MLLMMLCIWGLSCFRGFDGLKVAPLLLVFVVLIVVMDLMQLMIIVV